MIMLVPATHARISHGTRPDQTPPPSTLRIDNIQLMISMKLNLLTSLKVCFNFQKLK